MNGCKGILLLFVASLSAAMADTAPTFRFHSALDITTVDPAALTESSGGYIFFNLFRSLYRLGPKNEAIPDLAESCVWKDKQKLTLSCVLRESKFSNGTPIQAEHFISAWRRLVDPKTGSRHSELLLPLKNAEKIIKGALPARELGARAVSERMLEIELESADADMLYRLSSPVLTPLFEIPSSTPSQFTSSVTSGPYRISAWEKKTRLRLKSNSGYWDKFERPEVEVVIVEDDSTALGLYDLGKLDFLRRLTVKEIPSRRNSPEFIFHPLTRFDYLGFGADLQKDSHLRRALAYSLNYPEVTKLLDTPGKIGCPTLNRKMASMWPCFKQDLKLAKSEWQRVAAETRKQPLAILYSAQAGEDVARSMEWMQAQWKKNLGIHVELRPLETKMVLDELKNSPSSLYRKGVTLDRPTCAAALELFKGDNPENYMHIQSKELDSIIKLISETEEPNRRRKLCGQGLSLLFNEVRLIPLGEMYFAMLAKPNFTGWNLTSLNQLDLTHLKSKAKSD